MTNTSNATTDPTTDDAYIYVWNWEVDTSYSTSPTITAPGFQYIIELTYIAEHNAPNAWAYDLSFNLSLHDTGPVVGGQKILVKVTLGAGADMKAVLLEQNIRGPVTSPVTLFRQDEIQSHHLLLLSDTLSDIYLHVFPNETQTTTPAATIPAHKQILASSSDYFLAMFTGPFRESTSIAGINIVGYSISTVHSMLEHIYENKLSKYRPKTIDDQLHLLKLADQYHLPRLHALISSTIKSTLTSTAASNEELYTLRLQVLQTSPCAHLRSFAATLLIENIQPTTVFSLLECGKQHSEKLKTGCKDYIAKHWGELKGCKETREWIVGEEDRVAEVVMKV